MDTCKKGHSLEGNLVNGECRTCKRERDAAWVAAKRASLTPEQRAERRREHDAAYRAKHREQRIAADRERRRRSR